MIMKSWLNKIQNFNMVKRKFEGINMNMKKKKWYIDKIIDNWEKNPIRTLKLII